MSPLWLSPTAFELLNFVFKSSDMEKLKGGLLITTKEIQAITGFTFKAAQKEHKAVRDALGKIKSKRLTVKEYCDYYELDFQEVVVFLNPYR